MRRGAERAERDRIDHHGDDGGQPDALGQHPDPERADELEDGRAGGVDHPHGGSKEEARQAIAGDEAADGGERDHRRGAGEHQRAVAATTAMR